MKLDKLAANKVYLILFNSPTLNTKNTQKTKIKIKCQNLAIRHRAT